MKKHYYFYNTEKEMPSYMMEEYKKQNLRGAICGYMRETTTEKTKVTCKKCLSEINKQ